MVLGVMFHIMKLMQFDVQIGGALSNASDVTLLVQARPSFTDMPLRPTELAGIEECSTFDGILHIYH